MIERHSSKPLAIMATVILLQLSAFTWVFIMYILPVLPKLSFITQVAITTLFWGIPYYFSAFMGFVMQKACTEKFAGGTIIMGKPFKTDRRLQNPTNHIIASSAVIFMGLLLLAASRI